MSGVPFSSEVVEGQWTEIQNVSAEEDDFTPIGATYDPILSDYQEISHFVGANGSTLTPNEYKISGAINDGTDINTDNFVELDLRVNVPSSSHAGKYNYKIRARYSFGSE
ncbi:hypothetical protein PQ478_08310 [Alkalihalophilus pseudofirmus]|uniref:hypothetical protein n=1 Tax=Alkalihalophilus pseudofirmus TaxID=79885 RepID=UPI00259B5EBF|nr:hypothetical protein [Alkalihalophilus pseudofirmus]WEG18471.1 hypothetical protein PQ478_08310 [Alkalihalophilus pseudofirmus]